MKTKKIIENIWKNAPDDFMQIEHTSQKNVLHPIISKIINDLAPKKLLDYGSGDGRIIQYLDNKIDVDLFDINDKMLKLAEYLLKDRVNYYNNIKNIWNKKYDLVLLGMVIICLKNEEEINVVLRNIKHLKTEDGYLIISVPHPCFRDKHFSNFKTSFCDLRPFKYLNDATPFDVTIVDSKEKFVSFVDYHWSLSTTINLLIENGFKIKKIIETKDDVSHPNFNPLFSPYLIIIAN